MIFALEQNQNYGWFRAKQINTRTDLSTSELTLSVFGGNKGEHGLEFKT